MARQFILARQTRMRGVDLGLFDFDYDLTWMGFFLSPDGRILGRYGGRDADSAEGRVSLAGLRHAMTRALERHRAGEGEAGGKARTVDGYPAAKALPERACVRCHQVYDFRRQALQQAGKWTLDEVWVYPPPENVGLSLEVDRGDRVAGVRPGSPAEKAGLRKGDVLVAVNGTPVASYADVQYGLDRAPAAGEVAVAWRRGGRAMEARLQLERGWRKSDVSWRWSLRGLDPAPGVLGDDLTAEEKKALGLAPARLAIRQGAFVPEAARQAGLQQGDVIVGVDGRPLEMTGRQFAAHIRLTYRVGDRVTYNLLRDGKRVDVTLTLRARAR